MGKRYNPGQVNPSGVITNSEAPGGLYTKPNANEDAFGGGQARMTSLFGQEIQKAGSNTFELANRLSEPDKIKAQDAFYKASQDVRSLVSTLRQMQGPDSTDLLTPFNKQSDEIKKKYSDAIKNENSQTQELYNANMVATLNSHAEHLLSLQDQNILTEKQKSLDLNNQNFIQDAVLYKGNPNEVQKAETGIAFNTLTQTKGLSEVERNARLQGNITALYSSIAQAYVADKDAVGALNFLEAYKDKKLTLKTSSGEITIRPLNSLVYEELKGKIQPAADDQIAISTAKTLAASGMSLQAQLDAATKQAGSNSDLYKKMKTQIEQNWAVKEESKKYGQEQVIKNIMSDLIKNPFMDLIADPSLSGEQNIMLQHAKNSLLESTKKDQKDNMAVYAAITSGEIQVDDANELVAKYGSNFRQETLKELVNWKNKIDKKDIDAIQVRTAYQQAQQSIAGLDEFQKGEDGDKIRGQFFSEYQNMLQQLDPKDRKNEAKRQEIINYLMAPTYDPTATGGDWFGGNLHRFQLPYLDKKEAVNKGFNDTSNLPEALKPFNNVKFDLNAKAYFRDDEEGIRHIYDSMSGKEIWRGKRSGN